MFPKMGSSDRKSARTESWWALKALCSAAVLCPVHNRPGLQSQSKIQGFKMIQVISSVLSGIKEKSVLLAQGIGEIPKYLLNNQPISMLESGRK